MIDYVRIYAYGLDTNKLLNDKRFNFLFHGEMQTGEMTAYTGTWRDMVIVVNPQRDYVILKGSLHKYFHRQNFNQFTLFDFINCLELLRKDFGVVPDNCFLRRFEFGVNINTSYNPKDITERIIAYKRSRFNQMEKGEKGVLGNHCTLDRIKIKVYDKSKHYGLLDRTLRFEIVVKKMVQMHETWKLKIVTLADLTDAELWRKLTGILLNTYDTLLIDEIQSEQHLSIKEKLHYLRYCNSDGYERAKRELHRNTFGNHIRRFKSIQEKYTLGLKKSLRIELLNTARLLVDRKVNKKQELSISEESKAILGANAQLDSIVHLHKVQSTRLANHSLVSR